MGTQMVQVGHRGSASGTITFTPHTVIRRGQVGRHGFAFEMVGYILPMVTPKEQVAHLGSLYGKVA